MFGPAVVTVLECMSAVSRRVYVCVSVWYVISVCIESPVVPSRGDPDLRHTVCVSMCVYISVYVSVYKCQLHITRYTPSHTRFNQMYVWVYMYMYVCVCVYVCMCGVVGAGSSSDGG